LETVEEIREEVLNSSRLQTGNTTRKLHAEFHCWTADLYSTGFVFSIPLHETQDFSTDLVSVRWVLRFDFVIDTMRKTKGGEGVGMGVGVGGAGKENGQRSEDGEDGDEDENHSKSAHAEMKMEVKRDEVVEIGSSEEGTDINSEEDGGGENSRGRYGEVERRRRRRRRRRRGDSHEGYDGDDEEEEEGEGEKGYGINSTKPEIDIRDLGDLHGVIEIERPRTQPKRTAEVELLSWDLPLRVLVPSRPPQHLNILKIAKLKL